MQPRTRRQKEIYDYITGFIDRQGYQPSYTQIAKFFRIKSKAGVFKHIAALEAQGFLKRHTKENGSFTLEILANKNLSESVCAVAYFDTLTEEILEEAGSFGEMIYVPKFLIGDFPPENLFAFQVRDDSMIEVQIRENDIALFERRYFARSGEFVLCLVEKRRTVFGKYYDYGEEIEIQPMNERYEVEKFPVQDVIMGGVLRALLRPTG
jgi:repressor LexA